MSLRTRLDRLGPLTGRFESEFVDTLGRPRSIKTLVSGRHLVEWRGGLFRTRMIVVLFDLDHRFDAIVACHPRMRTSGVSAPATTSDETMETMSVRQTLALIDLRDATQSADARRSRPTMWARSRR